MENLIEKQDENIIETKNNFFNKKTTIIIIGFFVFILILIITPILLFLLSRKTTEQPISKSNSFITNNINTQTNTKDWLTFLDNKKIYTFKYPYVWFIQEQIQNKDDQIVFISNKENPKFYTNQDKDFIKNNSLLISFFDSDEISISQGYDKSGKLIPNKETFINGYRVLIKESETDNGKIKEIYFKRPSGGFASIFALNMKDNILDNVLNTFKFTNNSLPTPTLNPANDVLTKGVLKYTNKKYKYSFIYPKEGSIIRNGITKHLTYKVYDDTLYAVSLTGKPDDTTSEIGFFSVFIKDDNDPYAQGEELHNKFSEIVAMKKGDILENVPLGTNYTKQDDAIIDGTKVYVLHGENYLDKSKVILFEKNGLIYLIGSSYKKNPKNGGTNIADDLTVFENVLLRFRFTD